MTTGPRRHAVSVLENARIVQHDRIETRPLGFAGALVARPAPDAYALDLRDHLIFPGLINAHDHLQLNGIPRLPHSDAFSNSYEWIAAFESHRHNPDVAAAVSVPVDARYWQGALKNLLAGVTTVAHHDPWHAIFDDRDFPVDLLRDFGWSHSLGLGTPNGDRPAKYGPPPLESFLATPARQPWIIHAAEGVDDVASAEVAQLDAARCLAANTIIVHGVGMTSRDVDRVLAAGASVVWCPSSNIELFGRTLDPRRLLAAGGLALGSDSRLTGSNDLLDELRVASANSDLSPRELLRMVTADASSVLRLPDRGTLEPGWRADCLIVRQTSEPYDMLIDTRRSAIRAVVRNGMPVIADPDFADWFAHCGIETVAARLDGAPKLFARAVTRFGNAGEPGLEIAQGRDD